MSASGHDPDVYRNATPLRIVSPSDVPERRGLQHGQRVGRDVADRRGDDERPGLLDRPRGAGTRAFRRSGGSTPARRGAAGRDSSWQVSHDTSPACAAVAASTVIRAAFAVIGDRGRRHGGISSSVPFHPRPERAGIEGDHDGRKEQDQRADRVHADARVDGGELRDLDQRDEDAQHHHLEHRPHLEMVHPAQHRADPDRDGVQARREQQRQHEREVAAGGDHRAERDQDAR